jgi:hypothetical protein
MDTQRDDRAHVARRAPTIALWHMRMKEGAR